MGFLMYEKIYLATKGAGLLGKTEWTDDEDEEEEGVAIEDAPTLPETVYEAEEATLPTENQTEENQKAQADVPTSPTEARPEVDDRPEVEPEVPAE